MSSNRMSVVVAAAAGTVGVLVGALLVLGIVDARTDDRPVAQAGIALDGGESGPEQSAPMGMRGMHHVAVADEFEFLVEMIPHHEEAIDRAGDLLERSERPQMQAFAREIIATQSAEVAQMREWLADRYPDRAQEPTYMEMMRDYSALSGDALDRAFLEDMIPHHMIAVMMSQQFVSGDLAEHPDVVPFAESIRDTQMREIVMMEQWLPEWFGADAAYRHGMGMGMGGA